jgi:hypothetical protein
MSGREEQGACQKRPSAGNPRRASRKGLPMLQRAFVRCGGCGRGGLSREMDGI